MRKPESNLLSTLHAREPGETCDSKTEYWHKEHCCLYCQPGTYVLTHCTTPHTLGRCQPCPLGEYAPHNKLEVCRPCTQCRREQVMLSPCWSYVDTECQCQEGYYCATPDCETCQHCSKRCPEGEEILQACNATSNIVCGAPDQGHTSGADSVHLPFLDFGLWILGVFVLIWHCTGGIG
ncbi:tumor necrosis factor receptor superfamily member 26-like [Macrotis lagotis]|uniref:tumor necrosis factor receptor superfamily member 26-like n=1 Tax=Macrotis lagotis TaxID=92651 RepID=UPI003D683FB7